MTVSPEPSAALLLYLVKRLELATRAQLDAVLRPSGVTALQYTALTVLKRQRTMSAADLARASFVRAQSTSDLVSALERRGLIQRSADPANRRRLLISLTAAGHAFLAQYNPMVEELEERMLAGFDAADRDRFRDYLVAGRRAISDDPRA
ncbi:MarR family winged helix-turn-helix transcriptional regulator [Nocardia sp. alder85J]|uniref:MarR family winged helix-turn-helix transcriptional regulator n=1 Tax=Nocardia sp. alder85J TaxID=2862949 RepID=UPI001CD5451B|nr:MarR family transcriptional regulator [Nocardia sp. alder85J]MCX4091362.1 MarR family transcriptional regulator [Nocardia sp. alder85J]